MVGYRNANLVGVILTFLKNGFLHQELTYRKKSNGLCQRSPKRKRPVEQAIRPQARISAPEQTAEMSLRRLTCSRARIRMSEKHSVHRKLVVKRIAWMIFQRTSPGLNLSRYLAHPSLTLRISRWPMLASRKPKLLSRKKKNRTKCPVKKRSRSYGQVVV